MAALLDHKSVGTLLTTGVVVAVLLCVPVADRLWLEEEHGLLELPTAVALLFGAVLCVQGYVRSPTRPVAWWSAAVVMLALALRELDFQKRFTPMTIETTRFYISPEIPWELKVGVVAILLPVAVAVAHLGELCWRRLRAERDWRRPWVAHLGCALVLVVGARTIEKTHVKSLYVVEEVFELSFAVFLIWLIRDWLPDNAAGQRLEKR